MNPNEEAFNERIRRDRARDIVETWSVDYPDAAYRLSHLDMVHLRKTIADGFKTPTDLARRVRMVIEGLRDQQAMADDHGGDIARVLAELEHL